MDCSRALYTLFLHFFQLKLNPVKGDRKFMSLKNILFKDFIFYIELC